jgi:hypothetical protein
MHILINLIAFKIGWFASVFGAANELSFLGPLVIVVVIGIHLARATIPAAEVQLILVAGAFGMVCDTLLLSTGWLSYPSGVLVTGLSPLWIVGMWMLFATTFNTTLKWLQNNLPLAALIGAVSGPASYFFGEKLGAVVFNDYAAAMVGLAVVWGVAVPLLMLLARRLDGMTAPVESVRI